MTFPGLLFVVGVPLVAVGLHKISISSGGGEYLFGKPFQFFSGMFCIIIGLILVLISVIVEGKTESSKDLRYEVLTSEEILGELRSLANEKAMKETTKTEEGERGTNDVVAQKSIVAKATGCLNALALNCGKEQAQRKRKQELAQSGEGSVQLSGGLLLHKLHELELLCQEACYIILGLNIQDDDITSAAISLLALVGGDEEVRRRNFEEADEFGLDIPVRAMSDALLRAKACSEPLEDKEHVSAEIQRKGCLLLGALSNENKSIASKVVDENGLETILEAIDWYRHHEEVANWALWAIFVLCYDHTQNKGQLIKLDGINKICRVMRDIPSSLEVARHGTAILFDIMREIPDSLQDVAQIRLVALNAGMHDVVKGAMEKFPNSKEIVMMGQQMLVATGYQGEIPRFVNER